ncbi:hypothetical protein B0H63DRAFT_141729 [Podospora didyma]|uniref:Xylanolytic transcriptional activator regulatory domain-containing protein n=1 Tax=Podospora didyma TaxID=330526 RepID=A0AAE0NSK8_9PEZI|nr:hypothetical protein B0H63DRAFT_141729 [Podospora didyma]
MYPSHESQTRPQSPSTADTPHSQRGAGNGITVRSVCAALKISTATYEMLMDAYFSNMTSFSLFRPGSVEPKFAAMQQHSDAEALVAAMFSFSARHWHGTGNGDGDHHQEIDCPSPAYFASIASSQLDGSVDRYGDMRPPFWLLQAGVLVTFYQLTLSVRSRSWKKLGDCIRYSYDLNLHMVDANHQGTRKEKGSMNTAHWVLLEERRRAWWAVWEMDVFASTIRRLPTAIDASLNLTLLPVPDSCWFSNVYQESCFLSEDCSLRWKHLARSGNKSAKAWFIVVNSLMRNTQRIVYHPAGSVETKQHHDQLEIMANCLYCTVTSLPASLRYQGGETLDFGLQGVSSSDGRQTNNPRRQEHADKYALHLMTQLCRFMIYHHKICARAPWLARRKGTATHSPSDEDDDSATTTTQRQENQSEWTNYMNASNEIVTIVRSSARDHYRYVNPFLANTLWFAAAAQCACRVFGPASFSRQRTSSNLDVLKLAMDRFISFWGGMENLRGKLARVEAGLQDLMAGPPDASTTDRGRERRGSASVHQIGSRALQALPSSRSTMTAQTPHPRSVSLEDTTTTTTTTILGTGSVLNSDSMHGMVASNVNGWTDPKWSSFNMPHMYDFNQQQHVGVPSFSTADAMDFLPFGLDELLMTTIDLPM